MKAFSIIFGALTALSATAYFMGHENHLIVTCLCLTLAFVAWPDEKKEKSHE